MTTVGVKYHNEDIHFIIRKPMEQTVKSPRYKSKWISPKKQIVQTKKKYNGHQTFGLAHYEPPEFKNFLKKTKPRIISSPVKQTSRKEKKCSNCKNPPLPKVSIEIKKEVKKNFVKENIKKAVALQPKVPIPRKVETPRGTSKDLAHLLQMIKIRESEQYGKIPKYLCERKKQWEREQEMREIRKEAIKKQREEMGIGTMGMGENFYMVNQETRQKILEGLKENWNELSTQFLKLPVMTDTWPKIKRKTCLEKEIEQLERDIKLVECHPFIYLERHDRKLTENLVAEQKTPVKKQKEEEKEEEKEPKEETKADTEKNQAENQERKSVPIAEETTEEKKGREDGREDKEMSVNC